MNKFLFALLFAALSVPAFPATWRVKTTEGYLLALKSIKSGDSVVWFSGTYPDIQLDLEKNRIVFCAEKPGSVTFTGHSFFKLKADSVQFLGFQFKVGQTTGDILEVSGSHNLLENLNFSNYHSKYYHGCIAGRATQLDQQM